MPECTTPEKTGEVEQILPGGEATLRLESGTMLVANAIPGDVLTVRETGRRRGVRRGVISSIAKVASQRVDAACSVAADCGGCALQYLNPAAHAALKSAWVRESFAPFLDDASEWVAIDGLPEKGSRRRARWHRGEDDNGVFLGFHKRGSHTPVRTADCMVVHPDMDALRLKIEALLPAQVDAVQITRLHDGMHLIFEAEKTDAERIGVLLEPCLDALADDATVQMWWRGQSAIQALRKPVHTLHDRLPSGDVHVDLAIGPDDFVQGHAAGNLDMSRQLQIWAERVGRSAKKPRYIADLFCGIGNFSLPLAVASGAAVRGADMAAASIRQAIYNARTLNVQGQFDVVNLFSGFNAGDYSGADVLILDAPRKGAKAVCKQMGQLLPLMIVMVNCDIAAGARDAALLQAQGYRLHALRAFDLFAFSGHVEAMSCWIRA